MSIDEAIKWQQDQARRLIENASGHCEKVAKSMLKQAEHHLQIESMLEELKELRKFKEDFKDLGKLYSEIRADAIDGAIKKLAESEDTILSDRQYYTLVELKENNDA